jgi:hypothetical protein
MAAGLYCVPTVSSGAVVCLRLEVSELRAGFPERVLIISYSLNGARRPFAALRTIHGMRWLVHLEAALFHHRGERHRRIRQTPLPLSGLRVKAHLFVLGS